MVQNNFHIDFKLNGTSFDTVKELLIFTKQSFPTINKFLVEWFSVDDKIAVKTSGSTGTPKTICLKKEQMKNSATATGNYFNLPNKTSALLCLPIQYIAGKMMLVRALTLGWQLDIVDSNSNPLEKVDKLYDFSAMVPLQLENSLSKIDTIKKLIVGGGDVSNSLQKKLQTISTQVFATYGMTETITHIAVKPLNSAAAFKDKLFFKFDFSKTFYQALQNVNIYKDARNCLVIAATNVSEEIVFTNDVVQLISETKFNWLGRYDNVINSGGVKLHPEKIEEKLAKIITNRFFVTGIQDAKLGEKLVLIIENFNNNVISSQVEKSLHNKIKDLTSLSKFEIPKKIYFTEQFVETKTGKIQRNKTLQKILTK